MWRGGVDSGRAAHRLRASLADGLAGQEERIGTAGTDLDVRDDERPDRHLLATEARLARAELPIKGEAIREVKTLR